MIADRMTIRITEAELARDIHGVLEKVQSGVEVIVEQDHRAVAVIKTPQGPGRKISSEPFGIRPALEGRWTDPQKTLRPL